MVPALDSLPQELMNDIGGYLDQATLATLRLASKRLSTLFSPAFCLHIQLRPYKADLSQDGLRRLCGLAASLDLRAAVRKVDITCLHHRSENEGQVVELAPVTNLVDANAVLPGKDMCDMLTEALRGLTGLRELTLEAMVAQQPATSHQGPEYRQRPEQTWSPWRKLWVHAIQAYHIVTFAVARAAPPDLKRLIIYEETQRCSVPMYEVAAGWPHLEAQGFSSVASRLTSFSISLSTNFGPFRPRHHSMEQFLEPFDMSAGFKNPSDGDEAQIEVAARLLRFMSSLEYLRLHMYNTAFQNVIPSPVYQAFLDALAHYDFPRLQHLALCGLCASDVTLQTLVEKLLLLHILELRSVLLTRNSWEPVFAVLSQKKSLKRVALEGLLTPSRLLVNLEPLDRKLDAEDPKTFTQWIPHGPYMKLWHTREIEEEELRKGLAFRRIFSRISGSMADFQPHERFLNYLREYGPPPRGLWLG